MKFLQWVDQIRFRFIFIVLGTFVWLSATIATGDGGWLMGMAYGGSAVATLVILTKICLYLASLHVSRKGLFDYVDLEPYFKKAFESPEGAGLAIIGMGLFSISIAMIIVAVIK